jgi:hypothetical protein
MTWRRFIILVRGLSPHSATATAVSSRQEFGSKGETVNVITTPEQADRAFVAAFGHLKPKDKTVE